MVLGLEEGTLTLGWLAHTLHILWGVVLGLAKPEHVLCVRPVGLGLLLLS